MLVMKFGGTSVGNAERIRAVAAIIRERLPQKPVVIVSAVAGTTNALINIAAEKTADTRLEMLETLFSVHKQILSELGLDLSLLQPEFEEAKKLAASKKKIDKKVHDQYVSFGERMSAKIVAAALVKMDVNAKALPAWDIGMITDEQFGNAEPLPSSMNLIREKISAMKAVPIITGYVGKTERGVITTLGRGGSDYSAAIIGAALKAEAIQIWKEVDGIMTTDPRLVPEAQVVHELAFEEAAELAYFGAKVLHPKTILPAMRERVPVQVLNTFNPSGTGTTIVASFAERKEKSHSVEALTFKKGVTAIHVNSPEFFEGSGLMANIFNVFEKHKTSIDVVSTSVASVSLTIDNAENLEKIVADLKKFGEVAVEKDKAIVCAVGGSVNAAGVTGRMFTVLGENNIKVEMISQASGGVSVTFVVNEADAEKALKILHKEYIKS